jgi:DNA-binding response OmpR family regulator
MRNCPLCGSKVDDNSFQVDLSSNYIRYRGECRKAKGAPAEVLYMLARAQPRVIPHEELYSGLWGASDGPSNPDNTLKVHISQARKLVRGWDVSIINEFGCGYRLRVGH